MELSEEELSIMDLAFMFKIPLYRLLNEMPYQELIAWGSYFKQRPQGVAEDYRAALLISAFAPGAPIAKLFPNLAPKRNDNATIGQKLEGSAMLTFMLKATGGDKLNL